MYSSSVIECAWFGGLVLLPINRGEALERECGPVSADCDVSQPHILTFVGVGSFCIKIRAVLVPVRLSPMTVRYRSLAMMLQLLLKTLERDIYQYERPL